MSVTTDPLKQIQTSSQPERDSQKVVAHVTLSDSQVIWYTVFFFSALRYVNLCPQHEKIPMVFQQLLKWAEDENDEVSTI